MKSFITRWLKNESGVTLLETLLAMVLLSVIVLGGFQFFAGGRGAIDAETIRRLAIIQAEKRLELANQYDYASLEAGLNESETPLSLSRIIGSRTTVVTSIDDPIDGLATADADTDSVDYKQIVTTIRWSDNSTYQVSLSTYISADYHQ